ncbi:MAG: CRISPR-associated endonuclease Cas1 [Phycisphaeraceae bacterium]|nr:CRISPR-associated endonuclease Cas1 [Phycisphaeraceae bacterium]
MPWQGRTYNRKEWFAGDPVNRALSAANTCLYGLVHAAIISAGYSPAIGFIHTGKQLSFVYDIADLYKAELTITGRSYRLRNRGEPDNEKKNTVAKKADDCQTVSK